jgi:hypothetical protein
MCLAFLLERIEVASREFLYYVKQIDKDEPCNPSDIEEYLRGMEGIVFDRIYRLLGAKARVKNLNLKDTCPASHSVTAIQMADAMLKLRQQLGKFLRSVSMVLLSDKLLQQTQRRLK